MRALTWQGKHDVRVETVPDPGIVNPRDAVIRVTATAICGSDLHLYDHYIPGMKSGDILGHEFMGEVVEVGPGNSELRVGQRVVVPFVIACGGCFFCQKQQFAACDNSNPAEKADVSEIAYGYSMTGAFGYSHMTGGYAGGQAEYVRAPYSDVDQSGSLRFRARSCRARSASSPSITIRIASSLPKRSERKSSTTRKSKFVRRSWK